jgi:hypothetical protein
MQFIPQAYKLNHEVLPYEIEKKLPYPVIDNIYSFLRLPYLQTSKTVKMERIIIEYNHKVIRYKELLLEKKRRNFIKQGEKIERRTCEKK